MGLYDGIAQGVGIVAMAVALFSFQQKTQRRIVLLQLLSTTLFAVHFGLLGAVTGCLLNGIAAVRAALYSRLSTCRWVGHIAWVFVFAAAIAGVYVLQFTVLGTAPVWQNFLAELLPVLGMLATTVAVRMKQARHVRLFSLISSPLWLVYNVLHLSVGGIVTECLSIVSIVVGMLRMDRKKETA